MESINKFVQRIIKEEAENQNLEVEVEQVLNAFKDKLAKKGINIRSLKKLGVGTMGVAYDLGNKVLKVTKDVREAKASSLVAGKNIPNVIQVYDIWKFPGVDWYGLIIEKLTPLTGKEEQQLTNAVINTAFPVLLHRAGDDWNEAMKLLAQTAVKKFYSTAFAQYPDAAAQRGGQGTKDPRVQQFVQANLNNVVQEFDRITKEYKMRTLFKSLKALGIQYYDFHGGNYGRRADGTLVLFDLGRSISKGADPVELNEKFNLLEQRFGSIKPINELT